MSVECPYTLQRDDLFPLKIAPSHGGSGPHRIGSSVFAVLTSVTDRQTDRQTAHATQSVTIGRIYVHSTAMRPNNTSKQDNRRSHFARAVHSHHPLPGRSHLQRTRYIAFSMGKKKPKLPLSPWDFVTLPEEDRATAIGNLHRTTGKGRACGSGDILADRETHTHRQTC